MICRHKLKYHTTVNPIYEECHGFHLVEYDIICSRCGKTIGHYAYGGNEDYYMEEKQVKIFDINWNKFKTKKEIEEFIDMLINSTDELFEEENR